MVENSTSSKVSIAPMMDWTDRHCRFLMRLLSPSTQLYTEMVTAAAIVHGDSASLLRFDESEHPIALQLGGSDVSWMTEAAVAAARLGYDEININVGCPSDRVKSGHFGACLMACPDTVAQCLASMQNVVDIPVTVKTRIGIDDQDSYEFLTSFIDPLVDAGCQKFVVHARIAILDGLSPKDNRTVPSLNYKRVFRLKRDYPELDIVLNGGVESLQQVDEILPYVDGVMIGRQAYHDPYFLAELERHLKPDYSLPERCDIVEQMILYIEQQLDQGEKLNRITRHMLGLFAGQPGARAWRRYLSENSYRDGAAVDVVLAALDAMPVAA